MMNSLKLRSKMESYPVTLGLQSGLGIVWTAGEDSLVSTSDGRVVVRGAFNTLAM